MMYPLMLWLACNGTSTDKGSAADTDSGSIAGDDSGRPGRDTDEPLPDEDEVEDNFSSRAGDYAADFLSDDEYDTLVVEIDYVAGNAPDSDALDALEDALSELCTKPGGVQIILDDELPPQGSPAWSVSAGQELEQTWRDRYRDPDTGTAVIYYLYLDGNSDRDSDSGKILGYAYRGSSLVMFKETMDAVGGGLSLSAGVEETVIVHELGHLLGLVNNGIEMMDDHQDEDHGAHCDNDDCMMYWAVETDAIVDVLGLGGAPDFDADCRDDMIAAGGKQ